MSFTNNPYCTLQQVKNALNLTQTSDDAWIQSELIPEAQALIDEYIGHTYQTDGTTANPATRTYNGMNVRRLMIDECQSVSQVLEVQQITYLGANQIWVQTGSITTDITADCILGPYNRPVGHFLIRKSGIDFDLGTQNYTVKGVFGNPNVPWDITRACTRLCVHWFKMRDTSYADVISETGGIHQHYRKDMPPDVVEILERHRRRHYLARSL